MMELCGTKQTIAGRNWIEVTGSFVNEEGKSCTIPSPIIYKGGD